MDITDLSIKEFSELHSNIYRTLLDSLNVDKSWEQLLCTLRSITKVCISSNQIHNMKVSKNPSSILLHELQIRSAKVGNLQYLLRKSGLLNSLALISNPEEITIVRQPGLDDEHIQFDLGSTAVISCEAEGLPPPSYQWYRGNIAICSKTASSLTIPNFGEGECDEYYCIVYHIVNEKRIELKSNSVLLELPDVVPTFITDLPPVITANVGDNVVLHIEVGARPRPTYMWVLDNTVLEDETTSTLQLENVQVPDQGNYRCLIRNKAGETISKTCDLIVNDIPLRTPYENIASAKIALLIGNSDYKSLGHLITPSNDVSEIAHKMVKLDFRVIVLQNLTLVEMKNAINWFCQILPADAYAFFYFVGHGFQLNNKYMMPVDCPDYESVEVSDCYSDEMLIEKVMDTKAQLLVTILDMCLKPPLREDYSKEPVAKYKRRKEFTLIQNFSTSPRMEAFERESEELGVYAKHLIKFLCEDSPITSVLWSTIEEFAKHEKCDQRPSLNSDDPWRKKFTDPVHGDESLYGELCQLYRIPEEVELVFPRLGINPCIKLSFYKSCFVNALVFVFPTELNAWDVSAEVNQEELSNYQWTESKSYEKILTLFDLQKAKTSISIIIQLNQRRDGHPQFLDWCELDLACIEIVKKRLWFNETVPT